MANKKISQLTAAATLVGTEKIPVEKGGVTVYTTPNQIISDLIADLLGDKYDASNPNNYISLAAVTDALVTGKFLTGLNVSGSAVVSADSILAAIGKLQNQINSLVGGVNYQGIWNAAINMPAMPSASGRKGHYYVVVNAGSTNISGITDWKLGDWIISNDSDWQKVDNTDAVISVNGYTGIVTLTIADIPGLQAALDAKASLTGSETIENKRIIPRVNSETATSWTPNFDDADVCENTAINAACTINAPEVTAPEDREVRCLVLKDDNTARSLTFHGSYASFSDTLPTTTVAGKEIKIYLEYRTATTKWMCLSVLVEL